MERLAVQRGRSGPKAAPVAPATAIEAADTFKSSPRGFRPPENAVSYSQPTPSPFPSRSYGSMPVTDTDPLTYHGPFPGAAGAWRGS